MANIKVKLKKSTLTFSDLLKEIHSSLPHNITDFATFDGINPEHEDSIILSNHYLYNIHSLVQWIETKGSYINPYTENVVFSAQDQQAIADFYEKRTDKEITIPPSTHDESEDLTSQLIESLLSMPDEAEQKNELPFHAIPPFHVVTGDMAYPSSPLFSSFLINSLVGLGILGALVLLPIVESPIAVYDYDPIAHMMNPPLQPSVIAPTPLMMFSVLRRRTTSVFEPAYSEDDNDSENNNYISPMFGPP